MKKIHPPKYIEIRKAVDNAEIKFKEDIISANLEQKVNTTANDCPNAAYQTISDTIIKAYDKNYPTVRTKFRRDRHKVQDWMNDDLLKKIAEKDKVYVRSKKAKAGSPEKSELKCRLNALNQEINSGIINAKSSHYAEKIEVYKNDMKKTWTTINQIINRRRAKTKYPPFFEVGSKKITDQKEVAEEFNKFFGTIGKKLADEISSDGLPQVDDYLGEKPKSKFNFQATNSARIKKNMDEMAPKQSTGYDNLSPKVLKDIGEELAPALSIAINLSISKGIFPSQLKIAKIVPLFKNKGKIWHFENWRPVALLPALFKVYEKELQTQITDYFVANSLFCENQFGFRKNRSTEDAVLVFHDKIKQMLDDRQTPFTVFLDLSKAFDTIDHGILLQKLEFYGFSQNAITLMQSYLSDRFQYVSMEGIDSSKCSVEVGVPQGSILGPLLFLIYVNDLPNCTNLLDSTLFADDTSLVSSFSAFTLNGTASTAAINTELDKVFAWLCVNKLSLNVSKTKYMIFHNKLDRRMVPLEPLKINGTKIKLVDEFDFLGITIDSKLTWKPHTKKIIGKISRTVGMMKKIKRYAPSNVLKTLYQSLVNSHLTYGIKCWGFAHNQVMPIQKKAIRVMTNSKTNSHTSPLFKHNKILKVEDMFKLSCLKMHFKIEREVSAPIFRSIHTRNWEVHDYNTRQRVIRVIHPNFRSNINCFRFYLPLLINEVPSALLERLHTCSLATFSYHVKEFFLNQYRSVCEKRPCQPCGRLLY